MSRLTERTQLGSLIQKSNVSTRMLIDKLGEFEDLEEQLTKRYGVNVTLQEFIDIWFKEAEKVFNEKISKVRILTEEDALLFDEWKKQNN